MQRRVLLFVPLIPLFLLSDCLAQGEAALPFLLISPYAEANGMGEASVAVRSDDPLALMTNPARLGLLGERSGLSFGYNHSAWLPSFVQSDFSLTTFALNASVNLKRQFGISPDLSVGVSYSRVYLSYGTMFVTGPDSPEPIGTFNPHESSDQFSVGVGISDWVRASAGLTIKHVVSSLVPLGFQGQAGETWADVGAYDYGLFLQVPAVDIISRLRGSPVRFSPALAPYFDLNVGLARNNVGSDRVVYVSSVPSDPLPRYARAGIGVGFGLTCEINDVAWRPIALQWTVEANDLLVRRIPQTLDSLGNQIGEGGWEYEGFLGDIHFFDELVAGHANRSTIKKKGWQVDLYEIVTIRGGRFEEDPKRGGRRFSTTGFGVRFEGIAKLLQASGAPIASGPIIGFIIDHVDIRYDHSMIDTDYSDHPLSKTKFDAVNLFLRY